MGMLTSQGKYKVKMENHPQTNMISKIEKRRLKKNTQNTKKVFEMKRPGT